MSSKGIFATLWRNEGAMWRDEWVSTGKTLCGVRYPVLDRKLAVKIETLKSNFFTNVAHPEKMIINTPRELFRLHPPENLLTHTINTFKQLLELNLLQTDINNTYDVGTKKIIKI